jgi:hypothetical protein
MLLEGKFIWLGGAHNRDDSSLSAGSGLCLSFGIQAFEGAKPTQHYLDDGPQKVWAHSFFQKRDG